ncbi:MAG: patatin-like phospholipase family protein [Thermoproteota archaeon]|nr:patatin-like phospholipase family protein [Thermoproteota archaeon]
MTRKNRRTTETDNNSNKNGNNYKNDNDLEKEKNKRNDSVGESITLNSSSSLSSSSSSSSSKDKAQSKPVENVLILQGGGSLGAFGCGVFKALAKKNINIDIIAGTSIGAVNAAIIAGSKDGKPSEQLLEEFWVELSNSFVDLNNYGYSPLLSYLYTPGLSEQLKYSQDSNYPYSGASRKPLTEEAGEPEGQREEGEHPHHHHRFLTANEKARKMKQLMSFYSSAVFGNDKMFKPRWKPEYAVSDPEYFTPEKWTYLYDHSPLATTLDKYIDYDKLNPRGKSNARLIISATNVLTAEPLVFDSSKEQITPKHILAASGYPLYNFPWIEVKKGIYAWDGSLLSNTPLREAIDASPVNDKRIFLVENYPRNIDVLPRTLPEVHHRARDIMFSDKTGHNVTMAKVITRYLEYIEELYQMVELHADHKQIGEERLKKIRHKYKKYKQERGAEIKKIFYISRDEPFPHIYENADFSPETIKNSIQEGERKTIQALKRM